MKRIKSALMPCLLSASMITLTSCNDSNEEWMQNNADNILKMETNIVDTKAVVTGTEFKEGDKIGIYARTTDGHEYTGNSSNICAMYGRQWELLTDITLRKEEATIYAYYPYNASTVNTNDSINIDISPVKGDQPDYMYGSSTGVNQEQTTAKIAFKHALARVTLAITKSPTDVGEGKISKIRIENDTLYSANKTNNGIVLEKIGKGTELSVKGKMSLKDGGIRNTLEQNAYVEQSINRTINEKEKEYIDFLIMPCGRPLHVMPSNRRGGKVCAIITIDGSEYKVNLEYPYWEAGKQYTYPITINRKTILQLAKVGDYYYSDGSCSPSLDNQKTCIGIVFALTDKKGGDIKRLSNSYHGRIIAMEDVSNNLYEWSKDNNDVENITTYNSWGSIDQYGVKWPTITSIGYPDLWPSYGVYSDFNGPNNQKWISTENYPAAFACFNYKTEGTSTGDWYLPSFGEICLVQQQYHAKMNSISLTGRYWTSTEAYYKYGSLPTSRAVSAIEQGFEVKSVKGKVRAAKTF